MPIFEGYGAFNPFLPSGLFYLSYLESSISNRKGVRSFLSSQYFIKNSVFNANSVDIDQTPHSVVSDLSLHC